MPTTETLDIDEIITRNMAAKKEWEEDHGRKYEICYRPYFSSECDR